MWGNRTARASVVIGAAGLLMGRALVRRPADWYEPEAAAPIRFPARDDEAVLARLLIGGGITRDRYRRRLERLAAEHAWFAPPL